MIRKACVATLAVAGLAAGAQAALSFTGVTYTQNFDSLLNTGTANPWAADSTLPGWFARRALPTAPAEWAAYRSDNGATGSIYSFGSTGSTERAFGSVSSGTPGTINFALVLQNNTADVMTSFDLSFVGEQWRMGGNTATTIPGLAQSLTFDFKTVATFAVAEVDSVATGYTALPALDFASPQFTTSLAATSAVVLDGNLPANQASLSASSVAVVWNPGEFLILRWTDINSVNNDHSLAIDNLTFNAAPAPGAIALLGIAGLVAGRRKR